MPENKPNPTNPPAPSTGAGAKEGEQGSNAPLPRYVIPPQELRLLGWLQNAKPGERMELLNNAPPLPQGAVRIDNSVRFFNFRVRYNDKKSTLVILSGGFTLTVNPLRGIRVYKNREVVREYGDCWASLFISTINLLAAEYGYNIFNARWQTVSLPTDRNVRRLIALIASLINNRVNELRDPFFRTCLNNSSNSKTPS
jgi:hypothetical protein